MRALFPKALVACSIAAIAASVFLILRTGGGSAPVAGETLDDTEPPTEEPTPTDGDVEPPKNDNPPSPPPPTRPRPPDDGDGTDPFIEPSENLSKADRELYLKIQEALDAENLDMVLKHAEKAMKSSSAEVRMKAVEALAWFGKDALPQLTSMIADPDDDVSSAALSETQSAIMGIGSATLKVDTAVEYMKIFRNDEDALVSFGATFALAANDLISEAEDNAPAVCKQVVNMISALIAEGGACAEEATDRYREISGYEWLGEAEAARWAENPDEYEPPEGPEEP